MNNFGSFRLTVPLSKTENLKMGTLTEFLYNVDILGTGQNVTTDENREQISGGFGIGLENPGHSTWGFQLSTQNYIYDHQAVSTDVLTATDYNLYQVALGAGENWVSPNVALRGGLIVEEDVYSQSANQTILNTSAVAGLGYEDKGMKLDTKFLIGQEANLNYLVDNTYTLLLDVEIQGTLFL